MAGIGDLLTGLGSIEMLLTGLPADIGGMEYGTVNGWKKCRVLFGRNGWETPQNVYYGTQDGWQLVNIGKEVI